MNGQSAVSVAEAAAGLGVSTLRVRAHLRAGTLAGYRDNHGHWRVRLDGAALPALAGTADEAAITELLIEELLELRDAQAETAETAARLRQVIERQQDLLDRALTLHEAGKPASDEAPLATLDRAVGLAERAVLRAEADSAQAVQKLRARDELLDRALNLLESGLRAAPARRGLHPLLRAAASLLRRGVRTLPRD